MAFSFFKKRTEQPPEKMISRPAAASAKTQPAEAEPAERAEDKSDQEISVTEFSDFEFSRSLPEFQIDGDLDPINAPAEEAAVLFANHQDQAAQMVLESALQTLQSGPAERLWLMLFDLYRCLDQQPAFEAMGIEYARAFEKSPPIWGSESEPAPSAKASIGKDGGMIFKGDLLGGNAASFDAARQALEKHHGLRLDLSRIKQADPEGCAGLMDLLSHARKKGLGIELRGKDALISLVKESIEAGKKETPAAGKECWPLLLELFQQQGQQDVFEELAIDYAVTFEESPPSWDAGRVEAPEPAAPEEEQAAESDASDDGAYVLSGEIKSSRFADLPVFAQQRESLLIDCAKLARIDFVSAGALLNSLTTVRATGKLIVFRYPNHLVAELFRIVGLAGVATIVVAKH